MFGIDAPELLVIVVVAVLVIGPKDLPLALRTAGRWIGKMRRVSNHFRTGLDAMIREAEMEEMERKWKEQNEAVMKATPADQMQPINAETMAPPASAEARLPAPEKPSETPAAAGEPELPLDGRNA
ncbi:MAG TPA: Sec-independent protein translocase protein TatB [Croceibacterium sp.]|nr:Sec-independent protein translocase protein TatB [Croceibacterium sp.]